MFDFLYPKLRVQNSLNKVLNRYQMNNDFVLKDEITGDKYSVCLLYTSDAADE